MIPVRDYITTDKDTHVEPYGGETAVRYSWQADGGWK